jgi:SAM-dependent methyltransferase
MSFSQPIPDSFRPQSFRDPAGRLIDTGSHIVRIVTPEFERDVMAALSSKAIQDAIRQGQVIETSVASREKGLRLHHERVPFVSYPHEWPVRMLFDAAVLTLDLAEKLLSERIGLKDATPYNVLYRGARPVFVDFLSFEVRDEKNPVWLPFAQFVRCFLMPLLAHQYPGTKLAHVFFQSREGLEPEDLYSVLGLRRFMSPYLQLVTVPTLLGRIQNRRRKIPQARPVEPEIASAMLAGVFRFLRNRLESLVIPEVSSPWSRYREKNCPYSPENRNRKRMFVKSLLEEFPMVSVLDLGCNDGEYSILAAAGGARVVAMDSDSQVVGRLYQEASAKNIDLLPLVINLARPSPAMGWRNLEEASFLERAHGSFDCVMMLALMHHLLVGERLPLDEVIAIVHNLSKRYWIAEYVGPADANFQWLAKGRAYPGLDRGRFEHLARERFRMLRHEVLPGMDRHLYFFEKLP